MTITSDYARHRRETKSYFWHIALTIIVAGAAVRLWQLRQRPGWEWDEGVYTYVARNLYLHGDMTSKTDYLSQPELYLYHPPFYFFMLSKWFGLTDAGITQARFLAVIGSVVTMFLILALLRRTLGSAWALVGIGLLAVDMWLIFSQRVSWIENTLIPIGVAGLLVYSHARERGKWQLYAAAGAILGFAAIYKHIGVLFVGVVIVHAILLRTDWKKNLVALGAALVMPILYVGAAVAIYGPTFVHASAVQLMRSTGEQKSGGALTSVMDAIPPLIGQYRIYVATLLLAGIAVVFVIYRLVQIIVRRGDTKNIESFSILYAWALAAVVFFVALQLRYPHYSMLAFIPLFCYLVAEVSQLTLTRLRVGLLMVAALCVVVANAFAFHARFIAPQDSALQDIHQYAEEHLPKNAKVIADESVAVVIDQDFCIMWKGYGCKGATHIIVYTSSTQKEEDNSGQRELIDKATLLYTTHGFKETIAVYKLAQPIP